MRASVLAICFLSCVRILYAADPTVIRSVRISGNHAFTERQLSEIIHSTPSSLFNAEQLQQDILSLRSFYQNNGYYSVEIFSDSLVYADDSSFIDVTIQIREHEQSAVGVIELEGNTLLTSEEILSRFDTRAGNILDMQMLERDINELLSRYERIGCPFAAVNVKDIQPVVKDEHPAMNIRLLIDEGEKVQIDEIKVAGNKETKNEVIVRETRIQRGELFNQDKVTAIRQRLSRLNIFSSVSEPELYMNGTNGGLLITVQEGNTNTFDGVIGYLPGNGNESGSVTGLVNVSMRNLFGTARKLNIRWEKDDPRSQEIALRYVEPWVFSFPVNLEGSFFQRQQDTSYVRRNLEAKADVLITESFSIGGIFTHENIIASNTSAGSAVFNSRTITTGIEFLYDSRDDILSPTSGVYYQSDYRIGAKKIFSSPAVLNSGSNTVQKLSLDLDFFLEFFSRQVLATGLHGRQLTSDQIEISDLYRFGGTNTMRGYRENQFLGSRIAWTNTEYRFLLARRSFFYGFFDSGYYFLPGDDVKGISSIQRLKYGYGIGIRLETGLGNIGVSFALGEGDSFSQGKIHFGLINEF